MSSDTRRKLQKRLGPKFKLNILEGINLKMDKDEIELGDSLLTDQTLPAELPQQVNLFHMGERAHLEQYEEYLNDTTSFWSELKYNTFEESFSSYIYHKRQKFDDNMVCFLESQSFPLQVIRICYGKTAMGRTILKTLEAHHKEYRKNPTCIKGILTFMEKIKKTEVWQDGVIENC